jgi:hypothetical protein
MNTNQYVLVSGIAFRRNRDGILLRCLDHLKSQQTLEEFHRGMCRGHFSPKMTSYKIIIVHYYWPNMFQDAYTMTRKCIPCQTFFGKMKRETIPLNTISIEKPFGQWGLDVIVSINSKSIKGHTHILISTN